MMSEILGIVQAAIHKARWVDNFGKNNVIATDEAIAEAVVIALSEARTIGDRSDSK